MTTPLLTIGMAHFDDFSGLWPTIQSIRLNNPELMPRTEFIVVNNNPEDEKTADAIKGLLNSLVECAGSKYVEMPGNKGTSLSREQIFRHASGKYTAAMDCHLEFWPGSFRALLAHYETDPESNDIISGPLVMDSLRNIATHFRDEWDDAMWGKWAQAWQCQCGPNGVRFSMDQRAGQTCPREMTLDPADINHCPECGKKVPIVAWAGHEPHYLAAGFFPLGFNDGPAFEIPGQGLGFFSCRTAAWPGFNPHALGFGGEELYIHEKFRQRGGRAICVPGVKWVHRFYRSGGAKYPNTNFLKARNYVLEFQELGRPLDQVKKHFVDDIIPKFLPEKKTYISRDAWQALMDDAIGNTIDPTPRLQAIKAAESLLPHLTTIDQLFNEIQPITRDLNEHMPVMRELSRICGFEPHTGTTVELTGRRESTIALLAGQPHAVVSFSTEIDQHCFKAANLVATTTTFVPRDYKMGDIVDIPENDLLFIDTRHNFGQLTKELEAYTPRCRRFIVLHDTEVYGVRGDDAGLGLIQAIAEWCDMHPQWAVIDHTKQQYGLTVLSCVIEDRPENPVAGFNVPHGPGTELKKILHSLGIHPSPDCSCNSKAAQMDIWGIDGCEEPAKSAEIAKWLREGTWNGLDLASAVAKSFFTGIAFQINPLTPFESLVKLCIKRAKDTEAKRQAGKVEAKAA